VDRDNALDRPPCRIVHLLARSDGSNRGRHAHLICRTPQRPIFSFFPELSDLRTPEKDRIQLLHALTMSMGLAWVEAIPSNEDDNDEARMHRAQDACRYVLGLAVTAPPGQAFFYNTGALALVSAIIRKATGRPLDEFAREALLEPLGITAMAWQRYKRETDAGGGLRLRPREMAKSASSSSRGAAGTTVRSSPGHGSRARRHQSSRPRTINPMAICGGSAAPRSMGVKCNGLARWGAAASRSASSRSSISSSW